MHLFYKKSAPLTVDFYSFGCRFFILRHSATCFGKIKYTPVILNGMNME